jgi:hypothetical protein
MEVQAVGCAKNFQFSRRAICVWHLLRFVPMMNGVAVGPRSCNIDLPVKVHSMVTQLEIFYLQHYGIVMKILLQG